MLYNMSMQLIDDWLKFTPYQLKIPRLIVERQNPPVKLEGTLKCQINTTIQKQF